MVWGTVSSTSQVQTHLVRRRALWYRYHAYLLVLLRTMKPTELAPGHRTKTWSSHALHAGYWVRLEVRRLEEQTWHRHWMPGERLALNAKWKIQRNKIRCAERSKRSKSIRRRTLAKRRGERVKTEHPQKRVKLRQSIWCFTPNAWTWRNNVTQFEQVKDWASRKIIQLSHGKEHLFITNAQVCNFLDMAFWLSCFCFWQACAFQAKAKEHQTE